MTTEITQLPDWIDKPDSVVGKVFANKVSNVKYSAKGRRELIFAIEKEDKINAKHFFLEIEDDEFEKLSIPIGKLNRTQEKKVRDELTSDGADKDTILVPLVPLTFTTPDLKAEHVDLPKTDGFIYIFKDGFLWRELQVKPNGYYQDVNLQEFAGLSVRPPTAREHDNRILVPHKIAGEKCKIEICYSIVQWSWPRINAMGGMNPEDPRIEARAALDIPDFLPTDKQLDYAETLRIARTQEINLDGYSKGFPAQAAKDNQAAINNVNALPQHVYALNMLRESNIAFVNLHDPVGIAISLQMEYLRYKAHLLIIIGNMQADPKLHASTIAKMPEDERKEFIDQHWKYKTAVLTGALFFNKTLQEKEWHYHNGRRCHFGEDHIDDSDRADNLRQAAKSIDKYALRRVLRQDIRRMLRDEMRDVKKVLVDWMYDKGAIEHERHSYSYAGQPLLGRKWSCSGTHHYPKHPDWVPFVTALTDLYASEGHEYRQNIILHQDILDVLAEDPLLDVDGGVHDLPGDLDTEKQLHPPRKDPGVQYLYDLQVGKHQLTKVMCPTVEQCDPYSPEPAKMDEVNDGSGTFNARVLADAHAGVFTIEPKDVLSKHIKKGVRKILDKARKEKVVAQTINKYRASLARRIQSFLATRYSIDASNAASTSGQPSADGAVTLSGVAVALAKATNEPVVANAHIKTADPEDKANTPVDAAQKAQMRLTKKQLWRKLRALDLQKGGLDQAVIHDPNTGKAIPLSRYLDFIHPDDNAKIIAAVEKGNLPKWAAIAQILWTQQKHQGLFELAPNTEFIHVPDNDELVRTYTSKIDEAIEQNKPTSVKATKRIMAEVPTVLLIFEMWNLKKAVTKAVKTEDTLDRIKAVVSFTTVLLGTASIYDSLFTAEDPGTKLSRALKKEIFHIKSPVIFNGNGEKIAVKSLKAFGGLVGSAATLVSLWDAVKMFNSGDNDAGAVSMVGVGLGSFGIYYGLVATSFGPIGWGLLLAGIAVAILVAWLTDTDLEKWAKHGPFPAGRPPLTNAYEGMSDPKDWYNSVISLFMTPEATFTLDDPQFMFKPGEPAQSGLPDELGQCTAKRPHELYAITPENSNNSADLRTRGLTQGWLALDIMLPDAGFGTFKVTANTVRQDNFGKIHNKLSMPEEFTLLTPEAEDVPIYDDQLQRIGTRFVYQGLWHKPSSSLGRRYYYRHSYFGSKLYASGPDGLRLPFVPPKLAGKDSYQEYARDTKDIDADESGFIHPVQVKFAFFKPRDQRHLLVKTTPSYRYINDQYD